MALGVDQIGANDSERIEQRVPRRCGDDDDVVGRCLRLGTGGGADVLEQRVGLGDVDDAGDCEGGRGQSGPADGDGVTGNCAKVGRGLLEEENTVARAG